VEDISLGLHPMPIELCKLNWSIIVSHNFKDMDVFCVFRKWLHDAAPATFFGNDVFNIRFESEEPFPIFGAKYYFQVFPLYIH
jgi:hypothetical protein